MIYVPILNYNHGSNCVFSQIVRWFSTISIHAAILPSAIC